eukprot:gene15648-714_t
MPGTQWSHSIGHSSRTEPQNGRRRSKVAPAQPLDEEEEGSQQDGGAPDAQGNGNAFADLPETAVLVRSDMVDQHRSGAGNANITPKVTRDTMFQIDSALSATDDTNTDDPLPPVNSPNRNLSNMSDVTKPVVDRDWTKANPFSVEGFKELHDRMDQLTRRVNYHGSELEASLTAKLEKVPQGATVVYLDAEKHEGKNWRPALHASLPDSLYSAAIVFPLVAGASGTVDEAHQKKSHTLLPAHDTRRAESLKACYCRSNNSCGCMRFFQTWLSSTGSWIFSLAVSCLIQGILVFYLYVAAAMSKEAIMAECDENLLDSEEVRVFSESGGATFSESGGSVVDSNDWPIRLFGSVVINMYLLREVFETIQMMIWIHRQKWTSKTEYLQVLRADPEYCDPE